MKIALISDTHFGFNNKTFDILNHFYEGLQKEEPDIIVHAGDWIATKYEDKLSRAMKQLKSFFPETYIFGVLGNHDYWLKNDSFHKQWESIKRVHTECFSENGIIRLNTSSYVVGGVYFIGFDGWYRHLNPPTNDIFWMPKINGENPNHFMVARADRQFHKMMAKETKNEMKKVFVTHFPSYCPYQNGNKNDFYAREIFLDYIKENFDYYLTGHTHEEKDEMISEKCRILNCGSDYNKPRYKIFEV